MMDEEQLLLLTGPTCGCVANFSPQNKNHPEYFVCVEASIWHRVRKGAQKIKKRNKRWRDNVGISMKYVK